MAAGRIRVVRPNREERFEIRPLISSGSSFEQAAVADRCSTKTTQRALGSARKGLTFGLLVALMEREDVWLPGGFPANRAGSFATTERVFRVARDRTVYHEFAGTRPTTPLSSRRRSR